MTSRKRDVAAGAPPSAGMMRPAAAFLDESVKIPERNPESVRTSACSFTCRTHQNPSDASLSVRFSHTTWTGDASHRCCEAFSSVLIGPRGR